MIYYFSLVHWKVLEDDGYVLRTGDTAAGTGDTVKIRWPLRCPEQSSVKKAYK